MLTGVLVTAAAIADIVDKIKAANAKNLKNAARFIAFSNLLNQVQK